MKTIEERLEQMVNAQVRTADASERMAVALERMAAAQEASTAYVIGTRGPVAPATDAPKAAPATPTTAAPKAKKEKPAPAPEAAPAIGDLSGGEAAQYTYEDVAAALRSVIAKDGQKQTKAIELMVKYGANKQKPLVKDIKEENYAALIEEANQHIEGK